MADMDYSKAVQVNSPSMHVYLMNFGYSAYLKLDSHIDGYYDRIAFAHEGDRGDDSRLKWTLTEIGQGSFNRKTYSLQNFSGTGGFLFKGSQQDGDGDYTVYGHNSSTINDSKGDRYKFYLQQVNDNPILYTIMTLDGCTVFAGSYKDGDNDHTVYARGGEQSGDRFQWLVIPAD